MSTVFIRPAEGATLRYPGTMTPVSADGVAVELDTYWRRRIADGTALVVNETFTAATDEPETTTESVKDKHERRTR